MNVNFTKLEQLICQLSVMDVSILNEDTDLVNDLFYDSLLLIQLVVLVENEFNFKIEDEYLNMEFLKKYKWWRVYLQQQIETLNQGE